MVFAGDFFNDRNPGVAECYEDTEERTVYDVIEVLKETGLYEVEVRTDDKVDE